MQMFSYVISLVIILGSAVQASDMNFVSIHESEAIGDYFVAIEETYDEIGEFYFEEMTYQLSGVLIEDRCKPGSVEMIKTWIDSNVNGRVHVTSELREKAYADLKTLFSSRDLEVCTSIHLSAEKKVESMRILHSDGDYELLLVFSEVALWDAH